MHLDLSDYDKSHPLYDPANRKVPGKMKNEYPKSVLTGFVGLRSKCYCIEFLGGSTCKRAKGTKRSVIRMTVQMSDYEACRRDKTDVFRTQTTLRSHHQCIYTVQQTRKALSANDDKRMILEDGVNTRPWGYEV
jgi:hypothetical protein